MVTFLAEPWRITPSQKSAGIPNRPFNFDVMLVWSGYSKIKNYMVTFEMRYGCSLFQYETKDSSYDV